MTDRKVNEQISWDQMAEGGAGCGYREATPPEDTCLNDSTFLHTSFYFPAILFRCFLHATIK